MDSFEQNQAELFERLLRPHMTRLFRLAYRLTNHKADAEDLFQEVLARMFTRLDELAALADPGPWLSRVLYNQFVDDRRRYARRRLVSVSEDALPGAAIDTVADPCPDAGEPERLLDISRLHAAMSQLSDEHRLVVMLHDAEGYKLEEIHTLTGDPIGTVKSRLHRARARLRELLGDDGTFS